MTSSGARAKHQYWYSLKMHVPGRHALDGAQAAPQRASACLHTTESSCGVQNQDAPPANTSSAHASSSARLQPLAARSLALHTMGCGRTCARAASRGLGEAEGWLSGWWAGARCTCSWRGPPCRSSHSPAAICAALLLLLSQGECACRCTAACGAATPAPSAQTSPAAAAGCAAPARARAQAAASSSVTSIQPQNSGPSKHSTRLSPFPQHCSPFAAEVQTRCRNRGTD